MRHAVSAIVLSIVLVVGAAPARAHHSVPVNFDQSREVTVTGVITDIKWVNPHSHWRLDVQDDAGKSVEWLVEFGAINTMKRAGFPIQRFKLGDRVSVTGNPGRRERAVLLRHVLHDGVKLNPEMKPD